MLQKRPTLSIVLPCYYEKPVSEETICQLSDMLTEMIGEELVSDKSFLLIVNDGSSDPIWKMINEYHERNPSLVGLKIDPNAGHRNAMLEGLKHARDLADCVISIDPDLQDNVRFIREFVLRYLEGYEIGVKESRSTYSRFKRNSLLAFYRLMKWIGLKGNQDHSTNKQA